MSLKLFNVFMFQGGAPDKVAYGTGESDLYKVTLVDTKVQEDSFDKLMETPGYKVFASESQLSRYQKYLETTFQFDKDDSRVIYPRMRLPLDKRNLEGLQIFPNFFTRVGIGRGLKSLKRSESPMIFKPINNSGNRGILIWATNDDIQKITDMNIPNIQICSSLEWLDENEVYACQPFKMDIMNIPQLNVDFVVKDGKIFDYIIHEKVGTELFSRWVTGRINHSSLNEKLVVSTLETIISHCGIERGLLNFEAFKYQDHLEVFEINCRYSSTMAIPKGLSNGRVDLLLEILCIHEGVDYPLRKACEEFKGENFEYKIGEQYFRSNDLSFYNPV